MKNLIVFFLSSVLPFTTNGQDSQLSDYNRIDSSFVSLVKHCKNSNKKLFTVEFESRSEPDVDVFDENFELVLTKLDKSQILKFFSYFSNFYKQSEPDKPGTYLLSKMKSFLAPGTYSIEFNYKSVNYITTDIICLIYGHGKYILFSIH